MTTDIIFCSDITSFYDKLTSTSFPFIFIQTCTVDMDCKAPFIK